jgi:hypothetical protein
MASPTIINVFSRVRRHLAHATRPHRPSVYCGSVFVYADGYELRRIEQTGSSVSGVDVLITTALSRIDRVEFGGSDWVVYETANGERRAIMLNGEYDTLLATYPIPRPGMPADYYDFLPGPPPIGPTGNGKDGAYLDMVDYLMDGLAKPSTTNNPGTL